MFELRRRHGASDVPPSVRTCERERDGTFRSVSGNCRTHVCRREKRSPTQSSEFSENNSQIKITHVYGMTHDLTEEPVSSEA